MRDFAWIGGWVFRVFRVIVRTIRAVKILITKPQTRHYSTRLPLTPLASSSLLTGVICFFFVIFAS
jgi:hypothetical protein